MAIEQQTEGIVWSSILATGTHGGGYGQKVTISNRTVTKLSFLLKRTGSPPGTLTFYIRKYSNSTSLASKLWGNSIDVPTSGTWLEVTFDSPVLINDDVMLLADASGGSAGNLLNVYQTTSDVKASEYAIGRRTDSSLTEYTTKDAPYKYTYIGVGSGVFPSDPTTRVTSITHRYDEGTYTTELNLGEVVADFNLPDMDSRPRKSFLDDTIPGGIRPEERDRLLDEERRRLEEDERHRKAREGAPPPDYIPPEIREELEREERERARGNRDINTFKLWIRLGRPGSYSSWLRRYRGLE